MSESQHHDPRALDIERIARAISQTLGFDPDAMVYPYTPHTTSDGFTVIDPTKLTPYWTRHFGAAVAAYEELKARPIGWSPDPEALAQTEEPIEPRIDGVGTAAFSFDPRGRFAEAENPEPEIGEAFGPEWLDHGGAPGVVAPENPDVKWRERSGLR